MFSVPESVLSGSCQLGYLCELMLYPLGTDSAQPSITVRRGRGQWMDEPMCQRAAPTPLMSVRMRG